MTDAIKSVLVNAEKRGWSWLGVRRDDLRALVDEVEELREKLDEAQLRSIEARNPGIDMDEVKRTRSLCGYRFPLPWWAGEDQMDPCRCDLSKGHDGDHSCEHIRDDAS